MIYVAQRPCARIVIRLQYWYCEDAKKYVLSPIFTGNTDGPDPQGWESTCQKSNGSTPSPENIALKTSAFDYRCTSAAHIRDNAGSANWTHFLTRIFDTRAYAFRFCSISRRESILLLHFGLPSMRLPRYAIGSINALAWLLRQCHLRTQHPRLYEGLSEHFP